MKAEVNECRRELRLAKVRALEVIAYRLVPRRATQRFQEDKRRAERERDRARNERDDAQDKCKALEKKIHDLETENRNCEAIRQVTAAAVEASIEVFLLSLDEFQQDFRSSRTAKKSGAALSSKNATMLRTSCLKLRSASKR